MKYLRLLPLLFLSACDSLSPPVADPCPRAEAALRANSCVAIQASSSPLGAVFAWADGVNTWPAGEDGIARVSVQFVQGSPSSREEVRKRMKVIDDLARGLEFYPAPPGEIGDIRVSFSCDGHWSYLGRQALRIPASSSTMNIGLDRHSNAREWDRVVLHETLHAVGFEHEHQHPRHEIPWNREAVYSYYGRTQGWSRSQIDHQVLNRGTPRQLRTTGFDKDSIMEYPVPAQLTTNGFTVGWNVKMTDGDIKLLQELYP